MNPYLTVEPGEDGGLHLVDHEETEDHHQVTSLQAELLPPSQDGPSRATVWVPTDDTLLNLGGRFPGPSPPPLDLGVSARTRQHAHIHTTSWDTTPPRVDADVEPAEAPLDMTRTLARLGVPPRTVQIVDYGTPADKEQQDIQDLAELKRELLAAEVAQVAEMVVMAPQANSDFQRAEVEAAARALADMRRRIAELETDIEVQRRTRLAMFSSASSLATVAVEPHTIWPGYAMLTQGGAIHESRYNHILVSGEADVRVVAKENVTVGTCGNVFISATPDYSVKDYWQNPGDDQTIATSTGGAKFKSEMDTRFTEGYAIVSAAWSEFLALQSLVSGFRRAPREGNSGWKAATTLDKLLWAFGQAIIGGGAAASFYHSPAGGITGYAASGIHLYSEGTASLKSAMYTSISSVGGTMVSGTGYLGLSSQGMASLSGTKTSVTGTAGVTIESQLSGLTLHARTDAEMSSSTGKMTITSNEDAQLNSNEGALYLFGKQKFYLGCGGGDHSTGTFTEVTYTTEPGFGVAGGSSELRAGYIETSPTTYTSANPSKNYLKSTSSLVGLYVDDDTKLELRSGSVTLKGTQLTVDADTIHLG